MDDLPDDVAALERVQPVYELMPGWRCSTADARRLADLPRRRAPLPGPAAGSGRGPDSLRERGHAAGAADRGAVAGVTAPHALLARAVAARLPSGASSPSNSGSAGLMTETDRMEKLVSLCKRRGFVFQSSEIYGGLGSVWDYGPLGVELKRNIKDRWWRAMVHARDDIEGLDAAILMHPRVWEASGHVAGFTDPLVDCKKCKERFRADDRASRARRASPTRQCPVCGTRGTLTEPRLFNLMFKTFMGPVEEDAAVVLPAARDRAGHLRQLPQRAPGVAAEGPVRHRADRQGVPQRDHARQLHLPHARVRADGDAVLREAGRRRASGSSTGRSERMAWQPVARHPTRSEAALPPARARRAGALRQGGVRHRVRVPVRLAGARGDPQPHRLRPVAPPAGVRARSWSTSTRSGTSATSPT